VNILRVKEEEQILKVNGGDTMLTKFNVWNPSMWNEMSRLSREMDRLFDRTRSSSKSGVFPPFNLYDEENKLVLKAEIPGVKPEDLDINATFNTVTVKGERKSSISEEGAAFHRKERSYGRLRRSITLPAEIDADKVTATYKLGVLEITLPKAKNVLPKKVSINS
jgi:HSP20 family protein